MAVACASCDSAACLVERGLQAEERYSIFIRGPSAAYMGVFENVDMGKRHLPYLLRSWDVGGVLAVGIAFFKHWECFKA